MPSLRATLGGALVCLMLGGCLVKESAAPPPSSCPDGKVPRATAAGFDCVAPDSLPLSARNAQTVILAANAGAANDAGTALHALIAGKFAPSGQIHLGTTADAGEALIVNGGFHIQGFPVIGRVGTYAPDGSVSWSGTDQASFPYVLNVPVSPADGGAFRYRATATVKSDQTFPAYAVCEVNVSSSAGQTGQTDSYLLAASEDSPRNAYLEGELPGNSKQIYVNFGLKQQSDGGTSSTCVLDALTMTVEVIR